MKKIKVKTFFLNLFERQHVIFQRKRFLTLEQINYYVRQLDNYANNHTHTRIQVICWELGLSDSKTKYTKKQIHSLFKSSPTNIKVIWK